MMLPLNLRQVVVFLIQTASEPPRSAELGFCPFQDVTLYIENKCRWDISRLKWLGFLSGRMERKLHHVYH